MANVPNQRNRVTVKELAEYLQSLPVELQDCKVFGTFDSLDFYVSCAAVDYPLGATEVAVRLFY